MAESTDLATDLARTPKLRSENPEMIPKRLLQGMLALVLATVALVGYAALTGRAHVGVPQPSTVVSERQIILEGHSAQAVTVYNIDKSVMIDLPHGGFVTVIQSGLETTRDFRPDRGATNRLCVAGGLDLARTS